MSTQAVSVRVNIFNQTYSLRSASGDGEQVLRVARLVDERMRAVADGLAVHDVAKVAVLTALNLADELEGLRGFYESELRGMLERARVEEEEAEDEAEDVAAEAEPAVTPGPAAAAATSLTAGEREDDAAAGASAAGPATEHSHEEPSWFEAIFDTDAPPSKSSEDRLSSQVSSRLRSQVSARLRRLRQPSPANSIMEEKDEE